MRGRWASASLGAGMARRQASYEMDQQAHAYEMQQRDAQRQIEAQQRHRSCYSITLSLWGVDTYFRNSFQIGILEDKLF